MSIDEGLSTTRAAILGAAEAVFGERGFRKATLEDIAAVAGVSRPLVYRYFGDKSELFALVVERVLKQWNDVLVAEAMRTTPGTAHTLRRVLGACLEFARSRSVLRGLLIRDARLVRAEIGDVLDAGRALLPTLVEQILEQGVRRGDVRSDLDLADLAHVVSEVFVSYSLLVLAGASSETTDRRIDTAIEALLYGVIVTAPPSGEPKRL